MSTPATHLSHQELEQGLAEALAAPSSVGVLKAIVIRPDVGQRLKVSSARLTPEQGIEGDRWATNHWQRLPDGRPDPRSQVSLVGWRVLELIAGEPDRLALAGDNLILDLDVSEANLPTGSQLAIGDEVVLEITAEPHLGCQKFARRFGPQARAFVNSPQGKSLKLRGRYATIVRGGTIRVGDKVSKEKVVVESTSSGRHRQ
ncbi:MAG: MOSC domain-containing protein [Pirellulaceae bacterium]